MNRYDKIDFFHLIYNNYLQTSHLDGRKEMGMQNFKILSLQLHIPL